MKYDYYNNTGVFKPGYNVQLGVSSEYIRYVYVSQNPSDTKDFIPLMEAYNKTFGFYPETCCADAGYGSLENYRFCSEHNIRPAIKYGSCHKEKHHSKKDIFKNYALSKTADGIPICPMGHVMEYVSSYTSNQYNDNRLIDIYKTGQCANCPRRSECTKAKGGRTVQVCRELEQYKSQVRTLLETDEGKELMHKRSAQSEGAFGDLKQNFGYDRLKRRGMEKVEFELLLVACGFNIRKLRNRKRRLFPGGSERVLA